MGLTVPQTTRLQIAYAVASMRSSHYVTIPQADAQAILLLNNALDPIAAAFAPSVPIMPPDTGDQQS